MSYDESPALKQQATSKTADLSIVVACHTFVCAIPTRYIRRLALTDDVSDNTTAAGVVVSEGDTLASFNLGTLFGLAPLASAWVFLNVPNGDGIVPIALRTGTCLFVRSVSIEAPLPHGLFTSRGQAVAGAFVAGADMGLDATLAYGLVLDVTRLFSSAELRAAKSNLERARRQSA